MEATDSQGGHTGVGSKEFQLASKRENVSLGRGTSKGEDVSITQGRIGPAVVTHRFGTSDGLVHRLCNI